jgi:hypothetical protein
MNDNNTAMIKVMLRTHSIGVLSYTYVFISEIKYPVNTTRNSGNKSWGGALIQNF